MGRAAEPEILRRRWSGEMAFWAAVWVSCGREGKLDIRRVYIVGTAVRKVIFGLGGVELDGNEAARRRHTCSGLKGYMNSMEEPAIAGVMIPLTTPWMWWRGRRCRSRS